METERRKRTAGDRYSWDKSAEGYDDWYATLVGAVEHEVDLRLLKRHLPPIGEARILDAAGGTGRISLPLAAMGHRVTLCDLSSGMLEVARRKVAEEDLGHRIELVKGDICALAFNDDTFDLVMCWDGMSRPAARELIRVTKRGQGRVALFLSNRCRSALDVFRGGPESALRLLRGEEGEGDTRGPDGYPQDPIRATVSEARAFFAGEGIRVDKIYAVCGLADFVGLPEETLQSHKWDRELFDTLVEVALHLAEEPGAQGFSRHLVVYGTRMAE
jgi:SAM-dependent methyltransferase